MTSKPYGSDETCPEHEHHLMMAAALVTFPLMILVSVVGSLFGMAPGIVLMTVFGDRLGAWLRHPDVANLAVVVIVAAVDILLTWALRRWSRRRTSA